MGDEQCQRGQAWLQDVLQAMGYPPTPVAATRKADDISESIWLAIAADGLEPLQKSALLGTRGEPLDALQYLANTLLNLGAASDRQQAFTVEFEGHRQQRQQELADLAERSACQVRESGEEVELEHLTAFERRQMHHFFNAYEDIEAHSRGEEPNRHLIVRLRDRASQAEEH